MGDTLSYIIAGVHYRLDLKDHPQYMERFTEHLATLRRVQRNSVFQNSQIKKDMEALETLIEDEIALMRDYSAKTLTRVLQ